jgi:4'-phosphopantetheinyl transferase
VNVYLTQFDTIRDEQVLKQLSAFATPERLEKAKRFRFASDFHRAIVSELLVRYVLLTRYGVSERETSWSYHPFGKPYLAIRSDLRFNLSHSQNGIACVVGFDEVGVDLEYMKAIPYEEIANAYFSESEIRFLRFQTEGSKVRAFYKIWTRKESILKAIGTGLSEQLRTIEPAPVDEEYSNANVHGHDWHIRTAEIMPDYMLSVCKASRIEELSAVFLPLETIASYFYSKYS